MIRVIAFIILLTSTAPTQAAGPASWLENDWAKFIEAFSALSADDAFSAAGGRFPLVDMYSALSATGSAVKPGLQGWLRKKIADAYSAESVERGDRYFAFYACLTWQTCDNLKALEAQVAMTVDKGERFEPNLAKPWSSSYGILHWHAGWYGDENKTIAIDDQYWDEEAGNYVVRGRWGRKNDPDYKGGFSFDFSSACNFAGDWWYDFKGGGGTWAGNCN